MLNGVNRETHGSEWCELVLMSADNATEKLDVREQFALTPHRV